MKKKLSIAKQLSLTQKALTQLHIAKQNGDALFMCWIFYNLLGLKHHFYSINEVRQYLELFTLDNMKKHSDTHGRVLTPYEPYEYEERKKFLEWMISEYKLMLTKK